jgi:uncharacterized protein YndB with AHSA1/START domain
VDPVTLTVTIDRPREEVFAYLSDIANHAEFSDHYRKHWRLLREDSVGHGAGARFKTDARFDRFGYYDINFAELDPPYRIIGVGRGGKYNRIETFEQWTLEPAGGGGTRLEYMYETVPPLPTDRLVEGLSGRRRWARRNAGKALRRLRSILEEDRDRGARVTVGGLD